MIHIKFTVLELIEETAKICLADRSCFLTTIANFEIHSQSTFKESNMQKSFCMRSGANCIDLENAKKTPFLSTIGVDTAERWPSEV